MEGEVRPYRDEDYRAVVELAVHPLNQIREAAGAVISWASKSKDAEILVTDIEGRIVGFIMMEYPIGERWAQIGYIGWIAVHPHYQRRGYGRKLIQASEESARRRGIRKIYVEPSAKDDQPIRFYIANGFLPEGRRIDHHRDGEDSIILGKHL